MKSCGSETSTGRSGWPPAVTNLLANTAGETNSPLYLDQYWRSCGTSTQSSKPAETAGSSKPQRSSRGIAKPNPSGKPSKDGTIYLAIMPSCVSAATVKPTSGKLRSPSANISSGTGAPDGGAPDDAFRTVMSMVKSTATPAIAARYRPAQFSSVRKYQL